MDADETLERAHRLWFGRLVGWLFRRTGDLQLAEDAVAAAFASAVTAWRSGGAPAAPEAWLRVAARNHAMSALRRDARVSSASTEWLDELVAEPEPEPVDAIDERLSLMFVCAHPAIDPRMHAPLMLQAVLGVDAARVASVFLVPPATMGQRLSRAKQKIRDARLRYEVPAADEFPARFAAVGQAVYGAFGLADPVAGLAESRDESLRAEALHLSGVLTELLPAEPEAWGLRALLLHTEARRPGRVVSGEFVPLARQDTALWSVARRREADACLARAGRLGRVGRFQLEAAISAVHSARAETGLTDWESIAVLYRGLLELAPSIGAAIGAASASFEIGDLAAARELLDALPAGAVAEYQPYWVCRAHLLSAAADALGAAEAGRRAIGLTSDPAVRRHLIETLQHGPAPEPAPPRPSDGVGQP